MECACAVLSSVTCPAVQYLSRLSNKRHHFRGLGGGEVFELKIYVLIFSTAVYETVIILKKKNK